jgi:putative endopeptidase
MIKQLAILTIALACAKRSDPPAAVAPLAAEPTVVVPRGIEAADLDRKVDPCGDFYDYANGAWRAANPIPAGQPRWSRRAVAREANRQQVRDLLAELAAKHDYPAGSTEQLAGDSFASCMDEAGVEAAGLTPLQPLLAAIDAARTPADLQPIIRRFHELGIAAPFGTLGVFDNADPTRYVEDVVAGGLGLDRDAYRDAHATETQGRYRAHVAKVLQLGGLTEAAARDAAGNIFALEKQLAAASLDAKSAADPVITEHPMSAAKLAELAPRIDWAAYLDDGKLAHVDLNVADPKFLAQLSKLLGDTPMATWKLYLRWQLLDAASPWLAKAFADESFDFRDRYLGGATGPKPRAARCAELTESLLPEAVGKLYVERHFSPVAKTKAHAIADALLAAIQQNLTTVTWMGPAAKQVAVAKLADAQVELGYPDHWNSYAGVTIRRDALWANLAAGRKFNVDDDRFHVGKPTDRRSWRLPPSSPLAYIDLQLNELVLPAGFLQAPAFDLQASDAVNFGAMGSGLAHDLMHAIDATGSVLAIDGKPTKWWSATDEAEFGKRASCVSEQYEGFAIEPGVHHQGKLVLDEAIGDLGGLHLALAALELSMKTHPVPTIDGFTPEQQFFLAWGQMRGESMRIEAQRQMLKADIHPAPHFRVIGPLQNLPEFQQAFACKAGTAMVRPPESRCAIW